VKSFAIGCYEVTFQEYDRFCETTRSYDNGWGRGRRPVINVYWKDAIAYTEWLSNQTDRTYRLPTEKEWEYAARAGTETKYWWGNSIGDNRAVCGDCGAQWGWDVERKTASVESFNPNSFKIYDTVGNVWEWTCSEYSDRYAWKKLRCVDKSQFSSKLFTIRGGAWDESPKNVRAACRRGRRSVERSESIGFRVVRELKDN